MKKIINSKKYDTETAKEVGHYCAALSVNDFGYFEETLYWKKIGEFFLYGSGNAASKYSKKCGTNTWGCGEAIVPMTESEARDWAEQHLDADEYETIFGEVEE